MRRGDNSVNPTKPSRDFDEDVQPQTFKNNPAALVNTKKLRKIKDVEDEIRCHSARNYLRESGDHNDAITRRRSISPVSRVPPVDGDLPLEKFYKIYSKIVIQLEEVKKFAEARTHEKNNLVDLRRQLQRADEFSIRFSRNNLYETKRLINEIKLLIVPYPFEALSPGHCKALCKKIILAFQAASQSLQTYINYAKNLSNLEVPDKINELVLLIADLFLCCEHVSIPANDVYLKTDAVKVCNELMSLMKSKTPIWDYEDIKDETLTKKKTKVVKHEPERMKRLSMYKPRATPKLKVEGPKKKIGIPCLLGSKMKKSKKDEKKAKVTHEIYTQKLNPCQGSGPGSKIVKFKRENDEKIEAGLEKKVLLRRAKYVTPREVKSKDDDVETMVQNIGDDEITTNRIGPTPREVDEEKHSFKELLLEAIEELKSGDKKEQEVTLKKLLNSVQNCSSDTALAPNPEKVKLVHVVSKDLLEELENKNKNEEIQCNPTADSEPGQEKETSAKEVPSKGRKLKLMFKPLKPKSPGAEEEASSGKIMLKIPEETINNLNKYHKAFREYRKNNLMYKETLANKPWELVGKVSDLIILDVIKEISQDFENDAILRRLYLNELLEVTS